MKWTTSVGLSKATKIEEAVFRCATLDPSWIILALRAITSEHRDLQRITIHISRLIRFAAPPANTRELVGEEISRQWKDLDHLLAQLCESRALCLKIMYRTLEEMGAMRGEVAVLLPEITERGIIELVDLYKIGGW